MAGFDTPIPHKIYCVFKNKDKASILISENAYNDLKDREDNHTVIIEGDKGKILFEGKRREIGEFLHVYPREDNTPDEYKLYSSEYLIEKEKRTKFYQNLTLSAYEKNIIWSIIFARWGGTWKKGLGENFEKSWKAYFRGMFEIIALEKAGYKDKISSKEGIINKWKRELEVPQLFENVELYKQFIS